MEVAVVARRARTENFPVASVLFPRRLRPHLRAVYGFARLVDILGDEIEGDRLAALDELEQELGACYTGEPSWPVMQALAPTIHEFSLPREPFLRLIEANHSGGAHGLHPQHWMLAEAVPIHVPPVSQPPSRNWLCDATCWVWEDAAPRD